MVFGGQNLWWNNIRHYIYYDEMSYWSLKSMLEDFAVVFVTRIVMKSKSSKFCIILIDFLKPENCEDLPLDVSSRLFQTTFALEWFLLQFNCLPEENHLELVWCPSHALDNMVFRDIKTEHRLYRRYKRWSVESGWTQFKKDVIGYRFQTRVSHACYLFLLLFLFPKPCCLFHFLLNILFLYIMFAFAVWPVVSQLLKC